MVRSAPIVWGTVLLAVAGVALVASRRSSQPPPPEPPGGVPRHPGRFPRLDGSDTARQLLRVIAAKRLAAAYQWETAPDGRRRVAPAPAPAGRPLSPDERYVHERLRTSNTRQAYLHLAEGGRDLILALRPPDADEQRFAEEHGVRFRLDPVGKIPLVVLLNAANPLDDLPLDALRAIYAGTLRDWSALGGTPGPIVAYHRGPDSVSARVMADHVTPDTPAARAAQDRPAADESVFDAVAADPRAISYAIDFHPGFSRTDLPIKVPALDGVRPDAPPHPRDRNRPYPVTTDLLIATRDGAPPDDPTTLLRDWLLSDPGQQAVEECGFFRRE